MDKDKKRRRKRMNPETTEKAGYGNRGERDSFHPDVAGEDQENKMGHTGDIDYEDLEDKWYEIENEYRGRYPNLTEGDVEVEPAHFDRTIDRIGRRTERSSDEVRSEIENW